MSSSTRRKFARSNPHQDAGSLTLTGLSKTFGDYQALTDINLELAADESLALLGPSGCGKTTTLRLIAGFERPDAGSIELDDRALASADRFVPAEKRNMAVVFQNYALWPHMTVADNVGFGPRLHASRKAIQRQVKDALDSVQLGPLIDRYPHELSGGQQQRVSLARALITRPRVLLLDEPLSNLDTQLREEMRREIRRLHTESSRIMVYVTHDQTEALSLADRIAVMREGRIEQLGHPADLYAQPRNGFVAKALGATNLADGELHEMVGEALGMVSVFGCVVRAYVPHGSSPGPIRVSVRPGGVSVKLAAEGEEYAVVDEAMYLGEATEYLLRRVDGLGDFRAVVPGPATLRPGDRVVVDVHAGSCCGLENEQVESAERGVPNDQVA
ncbi:MAG: ABC transporter ATP-binding protein [Cumulibacter sp.]